MFYFWNGQTKPHQFKYTAVKPAIAYKKVFSIVIGSARAFLLFIIGARSHGCPITDIIIH